MMRPNLRIRLLQAKQLARAAIANKESVPIEDEEHLKEQREMMAFVSRRRSSASSRAMTPPPVAQSAPAQHAVPPVANVRPLRAAEPPPPSQQSSAPPQQQPPSPEGAKSQSIFTGPRRTVVLSRGWAPHTSSADRTGTCGVGISFQAIRTSGHMLVTGLVAGGSADASGEVTAGDVIHLVNNVLVAHKRIPDVVAMIKGSAGTPVVLELQATHYANHDLAGAVTGTLYASNAGQPGASGSRRSSASSIRPPSARASGQSPYPNYSLYGSSQGQDPVPMAPASSSSAPMPPSDIAATHQTAQGSVPRGMEQPPRAGSRGPAEAEMPSSWDHMPRRGEVARMDVEPEQASKFRNVSLVRAPAPDQPPAQVDPNSVGVGVGFQLRGNGNFIITGLVPGSTAAESGQLALNDRIHGVDGMSLEGLSVEKVVKLIRGPQRSTVTLTIEPHDSRAAEPRNTSEAKASNSSSVYPGLASTGLVVSRQPPYTVLEKSRLMDFDGVLEGSPLYGNALLRVGDEILQANHLQTQSMLPGMLQDMMYGPPGTAVDLMCKSGQPGADDTFFIRILCHRQNSAAGGTPLPTPQKAPNPSQYSSNAPPARALHVTVKHAEGLQEPLLGGSALHACRLQLRHPAGQLTEEGPLEVMALNSGQYPDFGDKVETWHVPTDHVFQTQLEVTIWDTRAGPNG